MCINLANERLQGYFNQHIFDMELNDCAEEGISMTNIQFTNNKPILDLFLGVRNIRAKEPYIVQTEFSKCIILVCLVFIPSFKLYFLETSRYSVHLR